MNKFINTYFIKIEILCTFVLLSKNGLNIPSMKRTLLLLAFVMSSVFGYSQAPPTAPGVPVAFKGSQINLENKALLEWTKPAGTVTGYEILYNIKGSTNILKVSTSLTTHTLTGLTADTVYQVKIRAINEFKTTPPKDSVFSAFTSLTNVVISKALIKPNIAVETSYTKFNQITLRLLDTNRYATHFYVRFEGEGSLVESTIPRTGLETLHTQGGLKPKTNYKITAYAIRKVSETLKHDGPVSIARYETTKVSPPPAAINFKTTRDCPYNIAFEWEYNASSEDIHYAIVQVSMDGWNFENIGNVNASARSFSWTGAEPTAVYHYRLLTQNPSGETHSGAHAIYTKGYVAPENPINIRTTYKTPNELTFVWDLGAQDNDCKTNIIANTEVQISINEGERKYVKDVPPYGPQSYTVENLQPGSRVEIFLRAHSDKKLYPAGYASRKDTTYGPPQSPKNLFGGVFKDNFNNQFIELWWDDVADEGQYYVERSLDGTNYTLLTFLISDITRFKDVDVKEGVSYHYRVKAGNWVGDSGYTHVGPFTANYSTVPGTPYGLSAKQQGNAVVLTWVDDTIKEESYYIEKSKDKGATFVQIGNVKRDIETYTDNNVDAGATYIYRVRAGNSVGYSEYSKPKTIVLPPATSGVVFDATVYPNPLSESINIKAAGVNAASAYRVRIFDQANKLVVDREIQFAEDQTASLKIPGLLPGSYHLQLSDGKDKVSKKIIKL